MYGLRDMHCAQMQRRLLDIGAFVLSWSGFDDQHRAAMDVIEVSIRKQIATLAVFSLLVILAQMPCSIFSKSVRLDEFPCRAAGGLMVGPIAALIEHASAILNELCAYS